MPRFWIVALAIFALSLALPALAADKRAPITGVWSATADVEGSAIPFRFELSGAGSSVRGHFFDGPRATNPSSAGSFTTVSTG